MRRWKRPSQINGCSKPPWTICKNEYVLIQKLLRNWSKVSWCSAFRSFQSYIKNVEALFLLSFDIFQSLTANSTQITTFLCELAFISDIFRKEIPTFWKENTLLSFSISFRHSFVLLYCLLPVFSFYPLPVIPFCLGCINSFKNFKHLDAECIQKFILEKPVDLRDRQVSNPTSSPTFSKPKFVKVFNNK